MSMDLMSCMRSDKSTGYELESIPVSFNLTLDKSMLILENAILARYLYLNYPESLIDEDTLIDSKNIRNKYYLKKEKKSHLNDFKTDSMRTVKKCSDILAFIEYYMNRFTSVNDDVIKKNMITIRHVLAHMARYGESRCSEPMKDNPLLFNKTDSKRICRCRFKTFPKELKISENNYDPPEKKLYNYNEIREDDTDTIIGLGDILNMVFDSEDIRLYVRIFKNSKEKETLPDEFMDEFTRYWGQKSPVREKAGYLPLQNVLDVLFEVYGKMDEGLKALLTYSIQRDISDLKNDNISPLDPYIGDIKSRDDDFEVSHSLTSKIFSNAEDYVVDAAVYARLLHCIFMDSERKSERNNSKMVLNFSPAESLLWMMDPVSIDRNYPPTMLFTKNCANLMKEYRDYLISKRYECINGVCIRHNSVADLAIEWPSSKKKGESFRDRRKDDTEIRMKVCKNAKDLIKIVSSQTDNNRAIVVTSPEDMVEAEELISSASKYSVNIPYLAVRNYPEYVSIRYDLRFMVEVGFADYSGLYGLHTNSIQNRRILSINRAINHLGGGDDAEDLQTRIEKIRNRLDGNDLITCTLRSYLDQCLLRMAAP